MMESKLSILLSAHKTRIFPHLYETQSVKVLSFAVYKRIMAIYGSRYNSLGTITYELVWEVGYNGKRFDYYKEQLCKL